MGKLIWSFLTSAAFSLAILLSAQGHAAEVVGVTTDAAKGKKGAVTSPTKAASATTASKVAPKTAGALPSVETAVFAGGCFWCMQPPFDKLKSQGVISTRVGYAGGTKENPTYEETSAGGTGHREAIEVTYNPQKISYRKLLETFWHNVDPFDSRGQFCDKAEQYTSAVFYKSNSEKVEYEKSLNEVVKNTAKVKGEVATIAKPFTNFYPAEDYHQAYYSKNPIRYKYYRNGCGRDARLKEVWGHSDHE